MRILKIVIGLSLFFLGLGFLNWTNWIVKVNYWARKYVFCDRWLLFHRRKIGFVCLVLSIILLYMGFYK
ncbi:hypothetical protein KAI68_02950 [bacterium]|nr:hypothetical protein [bacterium]